MGGAYIGRPLAQGWMTPARIREPQGSRSVSKSCKPWNAETRRKKGGERGSTPRPPPDFPRTVLGVMRRCNLFSCANGIA
jgi:hypothetical protein